jgi:polyferredoxin
MLETLTQEILTFLGEDQGSHAQLGLDSVMNLLPYVLGLGVVSMSHSVLALLKGKKLLALPITLISILFSYLAGAYFGANFFLVLFGSAMALSALGGIYTRKRFEEQV